MSEHYDVTITEVFDANTAAHFTIEPPIRFHSESARERVAETIRAVIGTRMEPGDADRLQISINHDSADGTKTIGFARFEGLRYATGKAVLQQGLELALNGTLRHVSPGSPLRDN